MIVRSLRPAIGQLCTGFRGFYRDTNRPGRFVSLKDLPLRAKFVVTSLEDAGTFPAHDPSSSWEASNPYQCGLTMRARGSLFYWQERPRTALIVKKSNSPETAAVARKLVDLLRDEYNIRALIDAKDAREMPDLESFEPAHLSQLNTVIDFVVSLGGDGTLLHVSSLFQGHCPPVLGFSMGTLGFLVPFRPEEYREAVASVVQGGFRFMKRMRLECTLMDFTAERGRFRVNMPSVHVLNEMTIHGETSRLSLLDCYVNGVLLARYQSDGLIASTSTGSTAYSLSCSGSLIHPGLHGIMVTPISPRQLSLRPAFLPRTARLWIELCQQTRDLASVWFDSQIPFKLNRGGGVEVVMSPYPLPTIINKDPIEDWVEQIGGLGFGKGL